MSKYKKPVTEIIRQRISVRSYQSKPIEEELKNNLIAFLEEVKGPFNSRTSFKLIDSRAAKHDNIKLGTYGMIRGASTFAAAVVEKGYMSLEQVGYEMESFVLYAVSLGLGTCWLGGTFKKGEFAKAVELKEQEILPVVTPLGYPSENKSILDSLVRATAGSKKRKGWEEIFFDGSFDKKLSKNNAGVYSEALEMVRLAPSASNKQPWRVVKDNDKFHFYLCHTKGYSNALGFDVQKIDMGICLCHFELTLRESKIEGSWNKCQPDIQKLNENMEYIISWVK